MHGRFGFGKNWESFLKKFSEERAESAKKLLLDKLQLKNLEGMTFLDIGSGSGLHSLAALWAGASRILSFDYDEHSVAATLSLKQHFGNPERWTVMQGSVLDKNFMVSLGKFDIVYSWGVLHHTGDMWGAIRNARIPLASSGVYFIALYSDMAYRIASLSGRPTPEEWLCIKQSYNKASWIKKRVMEYQYVYQTFFRRTRNPLKIFRDGLSLLRYIRDYHKLIRGMHFWTNVRDWLGGWPMEFVKESECVDFCNKELGLELVAQHTGEANSEFLFRPSGVSNYWDAVLAEQREISLPQPYENVGGYMWRVHIPALLCIASTSEVPRKSDAVLTENGRIIGYRHASHEAIAVWGGGGYSHWGEYLFFSTSDNTSPNENGRRYSLRLSSAIMNETKICAE